MRHRPLSFLVFFSFFVFSCQSQDESPDPTVTEPPSQIESFTYLALGDSYTIGESVGQSERYPVQLADSLRQMGIDISPPEIIAKTGWTTDELADGIGGADIDGNTYDLVSLLIGVNNQYRGRSVESYRPEFTDLLGQAIEFAGGDTNRVFVVSIPDYAFTPFGNGSGEISQGIDEYNAANRAITESFGIRYFDITPISREGLAQPDLVAGDGLHPSGEQYRRWVNLMRNEVRNMLKD